MGGPTFDGPVPIGPIDPILTAKTGLRDQLVTARGRLGVAEIATRARATAEHLLTAPEVRRAATVACYVSVGREPGTGPLLDGLASAGKHVILPVLRPDLDLDWARYDGPQSLAPAGRGLLEPVGPTLGLDAVATADAVLVPGLAVGRDGVRMGRGGGSYDRTLGRVPAGTFVCCVLNPEELVETVPTAPHDRRVNAVATSEGVLRLGH